MDSAFDLTGMLTPRLGDPLGVHRHVHMLLGLLFSPAVEEFIRLAPKGPDGYILPLEAGHPQVVRAGAVTPADPPEPAVPIALRPAAGWVEAPNGEDPILLSAGYGRELSVPLYRAVLSLMAQLEAVAKAHPDLGTKVLTSQAGPEMLQALRRGTFRQNIVDTLHDAILTVGQAVTVLTAHRVVGYPTNPLGLVDAICQPGGSSKPGSPILDRVADTLEPAILGELATQGWEFADATLATANGCVNLDPSFAQWLTDVHRAVQQTMRDAVAENGPPDPIAPQGLPVHSATPLPSTGMGCPVGRRWPGSTGPATAIGLIARELAHQTRYFAEQDMTQSRS